LRRNGKFLASGIILVSMTMALALFACGAFACGERICKSFEAFPGCPSLARSPSDRRGQGISGGPERTPQGPGEFRPPELERLQDLSKAERQTVFGARGTLFPIEHIFSLYKEPVSKRRFRERSGEFVAATPSLSSAANPPVGVFSNFTVTSPTARLFSTHIAVRK
jgi:hypothetical protein